MNYKITAARALLRHGGMHRHPVMHGIPKPLIKKVAKRVSYSEEHNFTFLRVAKAANSSITKTIVSHMADSPNLERDAKGNLAKNHFTTMPTLKQFEQTYKFAFVRNPETRVLSSWLDKAHNPDFQRWYGLHEEGKPQTPLSFSAFLERLDNGVLESDNHWAPQSSLLPRIDFGYDFVGKFETLEADVATVCESIFGRFKGMNNRLVGKTGANARAAELVSASDRVLIHKMYEKDYDLFYSNMI